MENSPEFLHFAAARSSLTHSLWLNMRNAALQSSSEARLLSKMWNRLEQCRFFYLTHFMILFCIFCGIVTCTEVCKIIPACLKIPAPGAARQLDQPCTAQSANFGKFWLNSQNIGGTILQHSVLSPHHLTVST